MLVGALRVFPRTVLPRHRPKSSMRQTGADSPAPSRTVHWTVCVPLWRERAVRIPSLREKQKALSPDGERAFCGPSVIIGFQKTQIYQRFAGSRQEVFILKIQNDENNAAQQDNGRRCSFLRFGTNCPKVSVLDENENCHWFCLLWIFSFNSLISLSVFAPLSL